MVLSTEWSQIEVIDLVNDGSGLGFGIVGGRSTGVVIKSILPGGIADKDSRLQSGDHILQIGEINCRGLSADQVATVLRQTGSQVKMVVARSVEPNSSDFQTYGSTAPVVSTKILTDPDELDRLQNGYLAFFNQICLTHTLSPNTEQVLSSQNSPRNEKIDAVTDNDSERSPSPNIDTVELRRSPPPGDLLFNIVEIYRAAKKAENAVGLDGVEIVEKVACEAKEKLETIKKANSAAADSIEKVSNGETNGEIRNGASEQNGEEKGHKEISAILAIGDSDKDVNDVNNTADLSEPKTPEKITENIKPKESKKPNGIFKTKAIDESCEFVEINDGTRVIQLNETYVQSINFNNNNISNNCDNPSGCHPNNSNNCQSVGHSPLYPSQVIVTPVDIEYDDLPETNRFTVKLTKNEFGLGITVAGYVCEKEDLNGIFVKDLCEKSEAFTCRKICLNDRILEVDGQSLLGLSNSEAVKKLKETGSVVNLTFERYLRGPKFEQLQEALAIEERRASIPRTPPSTVTLSWIPIENTDDQIEPELETGNSVTDEIFDQNPESKEIFIEEDFVSNPEDDLESNIKGKWEAILGDEANIVVCNLTKLTGLGISLEGTVDVEGGVELRPRHFIRSILPAGPVGQNGKLSPGDELLEVNGQKLVGLKHVEVVKILRELPNTVRLVCTRTEIDNRVINTSQDREAFEQRNILGGSLKNLLLQPDTKMVKALSDTSLNTNSNNSNNSTIPEDHTSLEKVKSRSMENTSVALWSEEVEFVELRKQDRGLGFSILDYQDPLDPKSSIIVVRGLIPNGPAEHDGRISPGDRVISVNGKTIKNFTLDQAVQVLKGTLPGIVRLGITKPLPNTRNHSSTVSSNTLTGS